MVVHDRQSQKRLRILHLVGSPTNSFFFDLSLAYAIDCIAAISDPQAYDFEVACISPDGYWCFPNDLCRSSVDASPRLLSSEAITLIVSKNIDVVIPQLFCFDGMTNYRSLFETLKIPLIGNPGDLMAIASNKRYTKSIVSYAGVRVASDITVRSIDELDPVAAFERLGSRIVVKPNSADNSTGVSIAEEASQLKSAIENALKYSNDVLLETYIPLGREVRCGVIENGANLLALPLQEYPLDAQVAPIRTEDKKLCRDAEGRIELASKVRKTAWIVKHDDPIIASVQDVALKCHIALGCRHYSLFDFRINPKGVVFFLEASLYCSFSPNSILTVMADATGISIRQLFHYMLERSLHLSRNEPSSVNTLLISQTVLS